MKSAGGKSEISKSLTDAVIYGPVFIGDYEEDMAKVAEIFNRDYSNCRKPEYKDGQSDPSRHVLSMDRTLGSVIKLLTPDDVYTDEHNAFVKSIPNHILAICFAIKSNYKPEMGNNWKNHFTVDQSNGVPGHELKLGDRQLVGSYLRVGTSKDGTWRNYKMRQDFIPAAKVQMEDDITASVVVPRDQIKGLPEADYGLYPSLKIAQNCEWRLFQRPDDAIHPGFDKQTEIDMSEPGLFCSNFQPIKADEMKMLTETMYFYDLFSEPMKKHMLDTTTSDGVAICSAKPRIVNGKPTANPRYLQVRPDVTAPKGRYMAELGARLYRRIPHAEACVFPVGGVLSGRRNNPPDELNGTKIRPLCVYNPLHYQEVSFYFFFFLSQYFLSCSSYFSLLLCTRFKLPELFCDYVCCVTGKSPSTTGAGSEGALSKGPFNAIGATADLNNMLVSMILTNYGGFSSAAGWIGTKYNVAHDISLLIPELWCRMTPEERTPEYLIKEDFLEPVKDFEYEGREIKGSLLGFRITKHFVHHFFCRIFDNPSSVFTEEMLQPELQGMDVFADGIENITQAMQNAALKYFQDGIIEDACPPLRAVLHIMAYGHYNGKKMDDPEIRRMFTRETLLNSRWYKARLLKKQCRDVALWKRNIAYLEKFLSRPGYKVESERLDVNARLSDAKKELERVSSDAYVESLVGTLGADPIHDGYVLVDGPCPADVL